uniref:DEP domain-containing protein n=1 Tax=Panagrolaimus davidi TaxID=227884 RepID=A0A914Q1F6_9BILA
MPRKCHWHFLWPYDNSFTGREAIEFLLSTLPKIIFGQSIQRINCSGLLQKFLAYGFIFNVRNPKDLKFSEKDGMIFRFNQEKIQYEIYKTNESTFNDSTMSSSPNILIRRALSNNDQYISQSDYHSNHRSSTLPSTATSPPQLSSFSKSPNRTIFSSFRRLKRLNQKAEPIFNISPPPKTPPPPIPTFHSRKRDSTQSSPPIYKKYPRLSNFSHY